MRIIIKANSSASGESEARANSNVTVARYSGNNANNPKEKYNNSKKLNLSQLLKATKSR